MSTLRTTWQVSRIDYTMPGVGAGTTTREALIVVGTYVGDQVAAASLVAQPEEGVPFVDLDAFAFLHPTADVREGDTLKDLERSTTWEAKTVRTYTRNRIVGLKAVKPKSFKLG